MRLVLSFFMILCFSMGVLAAIGTGAAWGSNDYTRGLWGFVITIFFIGLGIRYAFFLGKIERERRIFFPRRHWWQW
jgi:hypothetical protein